MFQFLILIRFSLLISGHFLIAASFPETYVGCGCVGLISYLHAAEITGWQPEQRFNLSNCGKLAMSMAHCHENPIGLP